MRPAWLGILALLILAIGALAGCSDTGRDRPVRLPHVLPSSAKLSSTFSLPSDIIGRWEHDNPADDGGTTRTGLALEPDGTGSIGSASLNGMGATKVVELTYNVSGRTVTLRHEYGSESFDVEALSDDYARIRMQRESPWLKSGTLFRVR